MSSRSLQVMAEAIVSPANRPSDPASRPADQSHQSISVVGLGYVGAVSMACLASLGHRMTGVDISPEKVRQIGQGQSPIVEARLGELLAEGLDAGRIEATMDLAQAVRDTEVTLLSVGTPTAKDGGCDLSYVIGASRAIGEALKEKQAFHTVVLRCSVPPGTTLDVVAAEIAAVSGKRLGRDFGVAFNPEFLREGVAVADFFAPSKTVIGASDKQTEAIVARVFADIDGRIIFTSIEVAELVKYVDNVWHATKVAFGNEVGRLCKGYDVDSHDVMGIFVQDLKLNLSSYYLKPGHAFGGSCLPKEVRAVVHLAKGLGIDLPLVESLIPSNTSHLEHMKNLLAPFAGQRLGFLGLTFKASTDDLRESPALELMASLHGAGWRVQAYDGNVRRDERLPAKLAAAGYSRPQCRDFLAQLPALLADDAEQLVADVDVVVVSHATDEFRRAITLRRPQIHVLDLARLYRNLPQDACYIGVAW